MIRQSFQPLSRRVVLTTMVPLLAAIYAPAWALAAEKMDTLSQKIDAEARKVLGEVKKTAFSHKQTIDRGQGVFETDSSGLVDVVLQTVSPAHLQAVKPKGKEARQLAQDYLAAFHAAPTSATEAAKANSGAGGWQRLEKVADLRPGDLLVAKTASDGSSESADAGHLMIVDEKPVEEPKQPDQTKTEKVRGPKGKLEEKQVKVPPKDARRRFRVVVIDSSKGGHATDSRPAGTGGVGRGTIWVDVDAEGRPVAIHWTSMTAAPVSAAIAVGRAVGKE